MSLADFKNSITDEIKAIISSDFKITVKETDYVPSLDDTEITYPNTSTKEQKCKLIETCVLYIDIRKSTQINNDHQRTTLAKLYSSFVSAIAQSAEYFNGKVRNIVGDRVMVLFDKSNCFTNAVNTAILMHSVSKYIINKNFSHDTITCGIGIDYGKMLVAKTGIIKRVAANADNKALVWLGPPANVASKLTDAANKTTSNTRPIVREAYHYPYTRPNGDWDWYDCEVSDFLDKLKETYTPVLHHCSEYFKAFYKSTSTSYHTTDPILMTEEVFNGFKKQNLTDNTIKSNLWKNQNIKISGYNGIVYGGDVIFTALKS